MEKPFKGQSPSNLAIMGRYILTPEIFPILEKQKCGINGEIQLTDSIREINKFQSVYALNFEGKRFDVGEKLGFLVTNIEYALKNRNLKLSLLDHLHQILLRENITL